MDGGSADYGSLYQDAYQRGGNLPVDAEPPAASIADSLPSMMYGFGDEEQPLPETVACMQQLVGDYIGHVTDEACKAAEVKGKLDTECFVFAVRNDRAKFKRVKQLLDANVHIKSCTRHRFVDDGPVYHPSFPPHPKVRAVVPLPRLSAVPHAAAPATALAAKPSELAAEGAASSTPAPASLSAAATAAAGATAPSSAMR